MSFVNNAILSFDVCEDGDDRMAEVNADLVLDKRCQQFRCGTAVRWEGGTKCFEKPIWGAAFNYVDLQVVMNALHAAKWHYPENVQLFWCGQEDNLWTIYTLKASA